MWSCDFCCHFVSDKHTKLTTVISYTCGWYCDFYFYIWYLVVRTLPGHRSNCISLDFHPFGEIFASGSSDTNLKIWDIRLKGGCIYTCKGHTRGVNAIRFTPDGRWVVSGGEDNTVKVRVIILFAPVHFGVLVDRYIHIAGCTVGSLYSHIKHACFSLIKFKCLGYADSVHIVLIPDFAMKYK